MNSNLAESFQMPTFGAAERQSFQEQGFVKLGRVLTDAGLARMREDCMSAWNTEKSAFEEGKSWLQNSLLCDIHHRVPLVRDFYYYGPLVDVAEQIIGPNIKGVTSQLTFKLRGNTAPFGWHQDNNYGELDPYNSLTTLTALDDTNEENGCLWILPGSHLKGQLIPGLSVQDKAAEKSIQLDIDENEAVPVPMQAGEAIAFHCWMLHKSDGNFSATRDRRILFLRYADADAVEVYNDRQPRLGPLLKGTTRFADVNTYEQHLKTESSAP